jgi:hypothetical protein
MEAVLFVFFLFAFVLVAPPHIVAITATGLLASSLMVRSMAGALSGVRVSMASVFRCLVLSFLLSLLASFAVMRLVLGTQPEFERAMTHMGANALAYLAYTSGFRFGLKLTWAHAALVAAIPAFIVGASIWLAMSLGLPALN